MFGAQAVQQQARILRQFNADGTNRISGASQNVDAFGTPIESLGLVKPELIRGLQRQPLPQ